MIDYLVSIITEGAIFAILALGLNIVWGWSGDFDLAYYGYVAFGAYMTMVLTIGKATAPTEYILGLTLPFPVAVILAVLSAMLLALIVGAIALRHLRGIYFSIVTLGAVYVLYIFASQFVPLFNEQYQLVVPREHYAAAIMAPMLDIIRGPEFRAEVDALGGARDGDQVLGHALARSQQRFVHRAYRKRHRDRDSLGSSPAVAEDDDASRVGGLAA